MPVDIRFFSPDGLPNDDSNVPSPKKQAAKRGPKPKTTVVGVPDETAAAIPTVVKASKPPMSQTMLIDALKRLVTTYRQNTWTKGTVSPGGVAADYIKLTGMPVKASLVYEIEQLFDKEGIKRLGPPARAIAHKHADVIESLSLNIPYSLLTSSEEIYNERFTMVWGSLFVFANPDLCRLFLAELPIDVQRVAERLAWVKSMSAKQMGTVLGLTLVEKPKNDVYYSDREILSSAYSLIPHRGGNYNGPIILSWPIELRAFLRTVYSKPTDYVMNLVGELPDGLLRWEEGDLVIFEEIQKLLAYRMQDSIAINNSGKVSAMGLKKMQKTLGIREFYPNSPALPLMRTALLAQVLVELPVKSPQSARLDTLELLEKLKKVFVKEMKLLFLLNDLKQHGKVSLKNYKQEAEETLIHWMQRLPVGEWMAVSNILNYAVYHDLNTLPCPPNQCYELQYKAESPYLKGSLQSRPVMPDVVYEQLERPALLAGLWLFAALGWLDVAYDEPTGIFSKDYTSSYDGLRYVQLNALGAHIFERTQGEYAPKVNKATQALRFDEQSLLIFCDPDNKVAETVLANYADRVSPTRFRVSAGTFLKGCTTKTQLRNKITLFSKSVAPDLPANWRTFFDDLLLKAEPVRPLTNLAVFALTNTDPALVRLMAQDAELKTMVIKAEGYRVLVEQANVPKFKKRLGELGYLV
jgi:hypothetical protein